jgi:hypothetical protein
VHGKRTKESRPRPANLRFGIVASLVGTTLGCVVFLGVSISPLSAEQQKSAQSVAQKSAQPANTTPAEPKSQAAPALAVPSDDTLVALISTTLIALNQADATGNYSVFRELGAPGFQVANSTGKLSETFAKLRSRSFDFSPIVLLQPKLIRRPEINRGGMLRVTGFFPTRPEQLNFDLIFQSLEGRWRLFGIAASTTPDQSAAPQASQPKARSDSTSLAPPSPNAPALAELKTQKDKRSDVDVRDKVDFLESASAPQVKPELQ